MTIRAQEQDMSGIIITANVVTGRIEVATSHWADDDRRWNAIRTPKGGTADAVTIEPWDEESMERATQAARDLGYTVTRWNEPGAIASRGRHRGRLPGKWRGQVRAGDRPFVLHPPGAAHHRPRSARHGHQHLPAFTG